MFPLTNETGDIIPQLSPADMTGYLTQLYGIPCVLRAEGSDTILCPYCGEHHVHTGAHGHYRAGCADYNFEIVLDPAGTPSRVVPHIEIGPRSFSPAYGYDIHEYKTISEGYLITTLN